MHAERVPDESIKRIVFLGLPCISFEKRVEYMTKFMNDKFPRFRCTCFVYFRIVSGKNERLMTATGFAEFVSSDIRDLVIKHMEANKDNFKFMIEGKEIRPPRSYAPSYRA